MSEEARSIVDKKIANKKVVVFSKRFCPYCNMAKDIIRNYLGKELDEMDYEVMELDGHPEGQNIQDYLWSMTGERTVPRVFINGKCIGGGTEMETLHRQGRLKRLLK